MCCAAFFDDDESDELFEFGLDSQPLEDLFEMDGLSEEQKQLLLTGKKPDSEFDKEFYALFRHRDSLLTQVFEMELDEDDSDDE